MTIQDKSTVFDEFLEAAFEAEYSACNVEIDEARDCERRMGEMLGKLHEICPYPVDVDGVFEDREFASEEGRTIFCSYALAAYLYALRPSESRRRVMNILLNDWDEWKEENSQET